MRYYDTVQCTVGGKKLKEYVVALNSLLSVFAG